MDQAKATGPSTASMVAAMIDGQYEDASKIGELAKVGQFKLE